eukprot:TRINITY_DN2252_c0_g1_i2.p1 TRINITY_DN2252_c0_g1~~TRINITY_DN2252_c0_g1_i2.p1  ORF type:complete len:308 (+),score=84.48 TRINITY_DN2252_c0_g1_i2:200-1123(+)
MAEKDELDLHQTRAAKIIFQGWDKNGDGLIDANEIPSELVALFASMDTDNSFSIDCDEFIAYLETFKAEEGSEALDEILTGLKHSMSSLTDGQRAMARNVFDRIDRDGNNKIDPDEIPEELLECMPKFDRDQDFHWDLEEFEAYLRDYKFDQGDQAVELMLNRLKRQFQKQHFELSAAQRDAATSLFEALSTGSLGVLDPSSQVAKACFVSAQETSIFTRLGEEARPVNRQQFLDWLQAQKEQHGSQAIWEMLASWQTRLAEQGADAPEPQAVGYFESLATAIPDIPVLGSVCSCNRAREQAWCLVS